MSKRLTMLLTAVALLAGGACLGAQSNTNSATGGIFGTSADRFLSVTDWPAVENNVFFLNLNTPTVGGGVGLHLGGLYFGAGYSGSIFDQTDPTTTITRNSTLLLNNNLVTGNSVTTTTNDSNDFDSSFNSAQILVGFAGMGLSASVVQSSTSQMNRYSMIGVPDTSAVGTWSDLFTSTGTTSDTLTEVSDASGAVIARNATTYTGGADIFSILNPGISWGTQITLGELVLKPTVNVGVNFQTNTFATTRNDYVQALGSGFPTYPATNGVTEVQFYTNEIFQFGQSFISPTGGVVLLLELPNSTVNLPRNVSLGYGLTLYLYSNGYTDTAGAPQTAAGFAADYTGVDYVFDASGSTVVTTRAYQTETRSRTTHMVTPAFTYTVPATEQLSLGISGSIGATFDSSSTARTGQLVQTDVFTSNLDPVLNTTTTTTKTYTGNAVDTTSLTLDPTLNLGLQFVIVPNVLTLNAGANIALPGVFSSVTETTQPGINTLTVHAVDGDGFVTTDTYQSTLGSARSETQVSIFDWDGMQANVSGGLNLKMGGGVSLDLLMDVALPLFISGSGVNTTTFTAQLLIVR